MKKLRNDLLQSAIIGTEQRRDKALRELIRLQGKLDELRKKAARLAKRAESFARLQKRAASELEQRPVLKVEIDPITQASLVTAPQQTDDNDPLDIPEWLQRRRVEVQRDKDREAADRIKAEQAEIKRDKALARVAKMKAKQRGDTRKMPLSGKAALKFIKEGAP